MNEVFSTQAVNFINALQTDVDPRTGQFMVNLPLANLTGNNLLGPGLSLSLSYSPLSTDNYGFGTGFSLGITRFSNNTNYLELSNGEKYRVAAGSDTVRNQKLSNFRFAYTNGADDADGYTVFWKEGKQELLTPVGGGIFIATQITSPLGRILALSWDWDGQHPLLSKVNDESAVLCQLTYATTTVLTVWPDTKDEYQITFELINDSQLDSVSRQVSETESMAWSLSYDAVDGASVPLLTGIAYPTGMADRVEYSQVSGHQFPDESGVSSRLPAVLSHTRSYGAAQPDTVRIFEYTEQNFLGYNGNFGDWSVDSDYLYTRLTDYIYGSTETVSDGDVTIITVRTYNNYHLQVSEEVTRQGCAYRTDFEYYAEQGIFIDSQPAQFQLQKTKQETWTDAAGKTRTQATQTEFDESGNPTRQVSPDGTEMVMTWYAAAGEDGCPAEPNGFVRFLKTQTTTPRQTDYDAPVTATRYTFFSPAMDTHVIQESVSDYADDTLLNRRLFEYNNEPSDAEYGRVTAISDVKYDMEENSTTYTGRKDLVTSVSNGQIIQESTFTGYDGLRTVSTRKQSALSGLLLSETDFLGVAVEHTYDKTGRLLSRSVAPGTKYENVTTWVYSIDRDGPVTTKIDAMGNQLKTGFDGMGRKISQHRLDRDGTQRWYEIASLSHNSLGEVISGISSDWLTGDTEEQYAVSTRSIRSGWGELSSQSVSDGTKNQQDCNPVILSHSLSVSGENNAEKVTSGIFATVFDQQSRLPLTDTRTDTFGKTQGIRRYEWDGLGRLRLETDELTHTTSRTYDVYGRVLTQTLPDKSVVTRTYAPHLAGDQVASISVTGPDANGNTQTWLMGTQVFDSLGRATTRTSGGRTTRYTYDGASPSPATVTLPSGKNLQYTTIPELGNVVSSLTTDDMVQNFSYGSSTADLLTAKEGKTENNYTWNASGSLKSETFTLDGTSRNATFARTLGGEVDSYTDITGKETSYERDKFGRIIAITDDALSVSLQYDALGRLSKQSVSDPTVKNSLITMLAYDDFGQEITRTLTDSNGVTLTVLQTWLQNGLMSGRTTRQDNITVREEIYGYDVRNRLTDYQVSGSSLPSDAYGHEMTEQAYRYDALNNLTIVITTISDGSSDVATYHYDNTDDPTQLMSVTHTHADYPRTITLKYDADGRMTTDEAGRTLKYDATGRLVRVSSGAYGYDALNRLVSQNISDTDRRQLYYRDNERVSEIRVKENLITRLIKNGHNCLGVSDENSMTLTACDHNDSLLWSRKDGQKDGELHIWSPYGSGNATDILPGFNGERVDPVSGIWHLGNGYRAYNPVLMRFNCPDSLSPFGAGGINPYAYCAGDPINQTDPSGHISWGGIFGIIAGVIGIGMAIFTAGASIAGAGGVIAAISAASVPSLIVGGLGVAADVTAIASGATEEVNPQASSILGWISLGTGLVGAFEGVARLTYKGVMRSTEGIRQRAATILEVGLSGRGAVKAGRVWAEEGQDVMTFLRADDRAPTEIKKYGGFTARSADSRENILSRFRKAFSEDAAGHSQAHVRQGNPDYISFGTDLESGGFAETRSHLYEVKIKGMKVTDITGDTMGTATVKKGPKVSAPRLLLSGESVDASEFVAMMPARTVEATFITPVPLQNITRYRYMGIWHTFA
ncbi:RHS repeat-associated core domain-containing protein [Pantoea agglomerans]|uniref:RHS repeat-associated core domain-containing protein n=1 Tax=Enterobacter agglomerans TaxID=549 RepID=UPI003207FE36